MFRFTIRDVLWLTVVVAMSIALYLDHQKAKLWEARAEYICQIYHRETGWRTIWYPDRAGFRHDADPGREVIK
jgi:hypothetical protein